MEKIFLYKGAFNQESEANDYAKKFFSGKEFKLEPVKSQGSTHYNLLVEFSI